MTDNRTSDNADSASRPWHALDAADALRTLSVDPDAGLSREEIHVRQQKHGTNRLPVARRRTAVARFVAQFRNILIYVLLGAAAVTALLGAAAVLAARSDATPRAVAVEAAALRTAPTPEAPGAGSAAEGAVLVVTDRRAGWTEVRLPDGSTGWAEAAAVEEL